VLALVGGTTAPAQDKGAVHNRTTEVQEVLGSLAKAMAYLKANFENPKTKRVIGSMTGAP